jgi:Zn finger protein HypA/HybF involved in hydrogenase expression
MEMTLRPGEKAWVCLKCDHETTAPAQEHVLIARCERCQSPFLQARTVKSTKVRGAGLGAGLDLGLSILMEMAKDVPDEKNF